MVPPEMFYDVQDRMEVALSVLGTDWQMVAAMKATMNSHGQAWINLRNSFSMEVGFLEECLEERSAEREKSRVLAVIPEKGTRKNISKCVAE